MQCVSCCRLWAVWHYNIFFIFCHKRHDFRGIFFKYKMCVGFLWDTTFTFDFLYDFSLKYYGRQEELSQISTLYIGLHVKYPLFLSDFNDL